MRARHQKPHTDTHPQLNQHPSKPPSKVWGRVCWHTGCIRVCGCWPPLARAMHLFNVCVNAASPGLWYSSAYVWVQVQAGAGNKGFEPTPHKPAPPYPPLHPSHLRLPTMCKASALGTQTQLPARHTLLQPVKQLQPPPALMACQNNIPAIIEPPA